MAVDKAPAFQFYPKDFLTDEKVIGMSNTEVGIYVRLLCYCWLEGSLPLETAALAHMARMPIRQFTKVWENTVVRTCFCVVDGRLQHKRLEAERDKQQSFKRRQSDNGKLGGRPRKASDNPDAAERETQKNPGLLPPGFSEKSSSSSSAVSSLQTASPTTPGPLNLGLRRFKVWRWMLDSFIARLGDQADGFDLTAWLQALDQRDNALVPRQSWNWLDAEFIAEAKRRGLPIVSATDAALSKRVNGCFHQPPCPNATAHTQRYLAEQEIA